MLLPWQLADEQPVFIKLEDVVFVAVFTTEEKLTAAARIFNCSYRIKQIDNGIEFLDSVTPHVRVMVDPWITAQGNTRFTEVAFEAHQA